MTTRRFVQIDGQLYERGTESDTRVAPDIMGDIKPYRSMIDGSLITSRSRHREHLRDHDMVEIGNDPILRKPPAPISAASKTRKELLISQVNSMTHEQFKAAGKRDLDRIRWNTRNIPDPLKEI